MGNEERTLKLLLMRYGMDPGGAELEPVPGGFSGAKVWRVRYRNREFALKRWPKDQPAHFSLESIHIVLKNARHAGIHYVPEVQTARTKRTVVDEGEAQWDLVTWLPGAPVEEISRPQLYWAIQTLSELHYHWRYLESHGVPKSVQLQLLRLACWTTSEMQVACGRSVRDALYQRAYHHFSSGREKAIQKLRPWAERKRQLHVCMGDIWSSHVLFSEDRVTGFVDFGGMRMDHPAQDLARLLGSYPLTPADRAFAVARYSRRTAELEDLVPLLIETGRVTSLGNWLRWLVLEQRTFADSVAVRKRVEWLVEQCEGAT